MRIIGNSIMAGGTSGPSGSIFVTGLSETDSVSAVHKKTVQVPNPDYVGLPDGYTELEYIESTGTQYINTGIILKQNYIVDLKANISDANSNIWLFGSDNNNTRRFGIQADTDNGSLEGHAIFCADSWTDGKSINTNQLLNIRYSLESTQKFLIDDVLYGSKSNTVFDATLPLYLFADNRNGSAISLAKMKCYRFTVSLSGSTAINDFIPAKRNSDSTIGIYDLVNDVFYTNAGTGTFTAGTEIPQYIETTIEDKTLTGKWTTETKFGKVPLIPTMTSNTTPSGTASFVNGTTAEKPAYLAFDGDDSTHAYSMSSSFPRGIQYKFDTAQTFTSVYIKWTPWTDSSLTITCALQTSMDGSTWATHNTETISFSSISEVFERTFELGNVTAQYIRYVVTSISNTSSGGMPNFCTMQAYYDGAIQVSSFKISPIRSLGTWTVTATDGEQTATQDVLVDVITDYEIEMGYKLWLYKDGVPYDFENFSFNGQPSGYGNNYSVAGKATTKKIDLSKYSKICCESDLVSNEIVLYLPVSLNIDDVYSTEVKVCENQKGGEYSLDGINEARYVAIGAHQGGGTNCTSVIEHDTYYEVYNSLVNHHDYFGRIWLE